MSEAKACDKAERRAQRTLGRESLFRSRTAANTQTKTKETRWSREVVSRVLSPGRLLFPGDDHSSTRHYLRQQDEQPWRVWFPALASTVRPCTEWGLPCGPCRQRPGALLPHPFTLTHANVGGLLSVALSFESPRLACASTLPCGARTFLDAAHRQKPSDAAIILSSSATSFFRTARLARGRSSGYAFVTARCRARASGAEEARPRRSAAEG